MKQLVMGAVFLGSLNLATGCIFTGGGGDTEVGDGGDVSSTAKFGIAWTLEGGCPAGATTVQVVMDDLSGATPFEDLFDCADTNAVDTASRPLGTYDVWINVTDDAGNRYASSFAETVTLDNPGDVVEVPEFVFPTDGGFMSFSWDILDRATNEQINCADVGADGMAFTATLVGTTGREDFEFDCESFEATTGLMPLGTYTVVIEVIDRGADENDIGDDTVLGTSDANEWTISYGNEYVDLGNFDFAFSR